MHTKVLSMVIVILSAITISSLMGAAAAVIGGMLGMTAVERFTAFGATAAFGFGAVLGIASMLHAFFSVGDNHRHGESIEKRKDADQEQGGLRS